MNIPIFFKGIFLKEFSDSLLFFFQTTANHSVKYLHCGFNAFGVISIRPFQISKSFEKYSEITKFQALNNYKFWEISQIWLRGGTTVY